MKKKVTIRDIAKKAKVSDATVSLAFQEGSRISAETTKKILKIAEELNYFPNLSARNLRYGHSKKIGFIVNDITDPFYARMIHCAEEICEAADYSIIFAESNWDSEKERKIVSEMVGSQIQGLILCLSERNEESYNLIKRFKLPHVSVDTFPAYYKGPYVVNDVIKAGFIAARHLVEIGCTKLAFFNAGKEMSFFSSFKALQKGFKKYINRIDNKVLEYSMVYSDLTFEGGIKGYADLRAKNKDYDGIFCVNDLCAYGVMEKAEQHGLRVGKDIAVMGIDNLETSKFSRISLTSINQPYETVIEEATKYLIERIEGRVSTNIKKKIEPNLIIRESTSKFQDVNNS